MANQEDIARQQQLLQAHRRTLTVYLNQLAAFGGRAYATPAVLNGIDETWEHICILKERLQQLGAPVEDDITDELIASTRSIRDASRHPQRAGDTPLGTSLLLGRFNVGLGALRTLIEHVPEIHDAAIEFRTIFQAACEQINTLRAYKSLHDQLHEVQFRCFENIEQELPHLLDNALAIVNLEQYALNLADCITELREVAEQAPMLRPAPTWIDKLEQAHTQIVQALVEKDADLLRRATDQIRRVLILHPARINSQLNTTVRAMRLVSLVEVITYMRDTCVSLGLDAAIIERIELGLVALRELNMHLSALIEDHDHWQVIDDLLRLLSDYHEQDEVVALWTDLKEHAGQLYETSSEPWAIELKHNATQLEHAVQSQDLRTIMQYFRNYRSRAVLQFYRVDKQLKKLCDKLDRVDGPLAFVIGVLE